jgi:hypothetical protein
MLGLRHLKEALRPLLACSLQHRTELSVPACVLGTGREQRRAGLSGQDISREIHVAAPNRADKKMPVSYHADSYSSSIGSNTSTSTYAAGEAVREFCYCTKS